MENEELKEKEGEEMVSSLCTKLGSVIDRALSDEDQFRRYIVQGKGRNADGDSVTENVERIYGKVDFKSVKEAAGAIKALADSVRSRGSGDEDDGIAVSFIGAEEYAD